MKKIYMILAALTLLSMSLNAQLLPNTIARQLDNTSIISAGGNHHSGPNRAPLRINQGEYTLGPFEGDNFDNGIGYLGYPNPQWVLATALLDRSEFAEHEGDSIVGFRFALNGTGANTVRVSEFVSLFSSLNGYFDFDNSWIWNLADMNNTGGNHETITYETYEDIVIRTTSGWIGLVSINVYAGNTLLEGWTTNSSNPALPSSWVPSVNVYYNDATYDYSLYMGSGGQIVIPHSLIDGKSNVQVRISARKDAANSSGQLYVNEVPPENALTTTPSVNTWNIEKTTVTTNAVTIGNGAVTDEHLPVYGYYMDYGFRNQMIYTANQLNLEAGAEITSLTFYPQSGTGIAFSGAPITFKLGNTTVSAFSGTKLVPTDLTTVATFTPVADQNATAWTIVFDTPFTYTGGNILVETQSTGGGNFAHNYFMGDTQSTYQSLWSSGSSSLNSTTGTNSYFQPKATFGYEGQSSAGDDYVELTDGQWHEFYLDEPVEFIIPGDTISTLAIGYHYYQYPSTETNQQLYPIAVNSESADHDHLFYMYGQTSAGSSTNGNVTAANATNTNNNIPAYGFYQDYGYHTQMIYTATQLGLQNGDQITSLTFYTNNGGMNFGGSPVTISLGNTTTSAFSGSFLSGLTAVATVTPVKNTSNTQWVINFSQPFTYTGGNLLVDVYCAGYRHDGTSGGSYGATNFYGQTQSANQSIYLNGSSSASPTATTGTNSTFLPRATFGYTRTVPPTYDLAWWSLNLSQFGDMAVQLIFKESMQKTPPPTITYTSDNGYYYITATATDPNAEVTLTVGGQTATGTGSVTITVGRGNTDQVVTATATAQEDGKRVSDPTTETITIVHTILDPTPDPTITSTTLPLTVEVVGAGQGDVHMYITIDGVTQEVPLTEYLERTGEQYTVTVTVTAQINDGEHAMSSTTQTVIVPPLDNFEQLIDGWIELPGSFNNDQVINWNDYLMFVDRFSVSTATNNHPLSYVYTMTEDSTKLIRPLRQTNEHTIPVQHTRSKVHGFYTEQDVLNDTLRQIVDTCVINANVEMFLEMGTEIYYYTLDRSRDSKEDRYFLELSNLQFDGTTQYIEIDTFFTQFAPAEIGHVFRFDTINTVLPEGMPQGVDGKHYGKYDVDTLSYVPIVWTYGNLTTNKRLNWDNDYLHNSYGSPIWRTGVGQVEVIGRPKLERQEGKDGSTNWEEIVGNDTIPCSIYMITDLMAEGFLPSPYVTNIDYEPYMFRVWVQSPSEKLRYFQWVGDDPENLPDRPGTHYEGRGIIPADSVYLVWEEFIADSTEYISFDGERPDVTIFHKWKISDWETDTTGDVHWTPLERLNMMFAGQDDITYQDVNIIVRFYYRSTGEALDRPEMTLTYRLANRDGEGDRSYYGVEGEGDPDPDIPTFIKGVYITSDHGEVVSTTYYNLQGMQSSQPFEGINIIVTRYSDGTYTTQKVMRR